jgi:hypothetical protein
MLPIKAKIKPMFANVREILFHLPKSGLIDGNRFIIETVAFCLSYKPAILFLSVCDWFNIVTNMKAETQLL